MDKISAFSIGEIVTLNSHPLFKDYLVNSHADQIPPLFVIGEVFFENDKKKLFSDEIENSQISDLIKYTCVYFNNKKSEFNEVMIYHSLLRSYGDLKYHNEIDNSKKDKIDSTLITEVKTKYVESEYVYGKVVQFKTNKLESRKKIKKAMKDNKPYPSFTSPDFILSGVKKESSDGLFYGNGKPKKKVSEVLYKVMWFNHFQQKFSEKYLPKECFIEVLEEKETPPKKKNNV
ncbi:hypothetical protein IWQ47_002025 [Aquimarina sp. EL_43]|uniref:hypothetical protein n=1 Tax=unclassified Aquimarina TaxID=2627091 RepID=UPI0018CB4BC7|nr:MULTISPECIES: hypothetical protein [unclassified Aquimarina]MBG6130549.1 hypothetical protein [Aquimarina sp. EL_35]MBG6151305.1 hypothetical protein [Aquimarina sp. EL_32]MBG6168951.1 hypothetical protein [Aquimarina sp. EL_43]